MMKLVFYLLLLSAFGVLRLGLIARAMSTNAKSFHTHEVVPDVISVAPAELLTVKFPSGAEAAEGNELTPTQVKDQPTLEWNADPDSYYTLCMINPDAPIRSNPTLRESHHWLVGNIKGNSVDSGDVLSQYIGSGPPPTTGFHRFILLVFKQPSKIDFSEPFLTNKNIDNRGGFSTAKLAAKYNLGDPVAGNFYLAQYDDYVPILYENLGIKISSYV